MKTKIKGPLPALAIVFIQFLGLIQAGRVTDITPTSGSLLGATRLTIRGYGFAQDQFNHFQNELGNNVSLVSFSRAHVVPCDVIPYYTTPSQIVCTTRPSPTGEDIYNIRVAVDGKWLHSSDQGAYCGSECVYKFTKAMTPTITSITPRYGLPGTLLTLRGRIITDQVMETEGSDPSTPFLDRVYAGTSLCDMKNLETQKLLRAEVNSIA